MKKENLISAAFSMAVIILVIFQTYSFIEKGEDVPITGNESMDIIGLLVAHLGIPFFLLLMSYHFKYPFQMEKTGKSGWIPGSLNNAMTIYTIFAIATTMFVVVFFVIVALVLTYAILAIWIAMSTPLAPYLDSILLFKWIILLVLAETFYSIARFIPNIHTIRWTEKFMKNFRKAKQPDEKLFFGSITIALVTLVGKTVLSTIYLANLFGGEADLSLSEPATAAAALILTVVPIELMKLNRALRNEFNEAFDLETGEY